MKLNYINYQTLVSDSLKLAKRIPRKYDLVVGIPKSGMIPAYVIGLQLDVNTLSIHEYLENYRFIAKSILLVDDSITSGKTLKEASKYIIDQKAKFSTAVIYTDRPNMNVTYYQRQIDAPRVFQWNLFKHGHLVHACCDLDGVFCKNPTIIEDDNKPDEMIKHILNAEPLYIPKKPVKAVITNRIERYREQTELWLLENKVKYDKLIMYDGTANERRKHFHSLGGNGFWKAEQYKKIEGGWFIESDIRQAKQIKSIINDSVYCTDTMQML